MNAPQQVLSLHKELTHYEQQVYNLLDSSTGGFVSRAEIETALYGGALKPSNCVQVFVLRMRKKGVLIETKKGRGYRLGAGDSYRRAQIVFGVAAQEQTK